MPTTILTDLATAKIATASGAATQVAITHVAIGDGNGAAYEGDFAQTALRREQARVEIATRNQATATSWLMTATFPSDTPTVQVREIGFFDTDGDLIALATFPAEEVREAGGLEYLVSHSIDFSRIPNADGVVIVQAPDDQVVEFSAAVIAALASNARAILNNKIAAAAAHHVYPEA